MCKNSEEFRFSCLEGQYKNLDQHTLERQNKEADKSTCDLKDSGICDRNSS